MFEGFKGLFNPLVSSSPPEITGELRIPSANKDIKPMNPRLVKLPASRNKVHKKENMERSENTKLVSEPHEKEQSPSTNANGELDAKDNPAVNGHARKKSLEAKVESLQHDVDTLKAKQRQLKSRLNSALRRVQDLTKELSDLMKEKAAVVNLYEVANNDMLRLQEENRRKDEEMVVLRGKLQQSEEKQLQVLRLLEVRTADLQGAETFITTADVCSGADVIRMVELLNAEIFQASASIAEYLEDAGTRLEGFEEDRSHIVEGLNRTAPIKSLIGDVLYDHLVARKDSHLQPDPLVIQLALQAMFTRISARKIRTFGAIKMNEQLQEIYSSA